MSRRLLAALLLLAGTALAAAGQAEAPQTPSLAIKSVYGRDLFEFYCATCHGRDGKGAGPVAPALTTLPSDLTTIAARHGGTFPRERIAAYVADDGSEAVAAHGSKDMPVWGPIFRALDPSDTRARIRIANLVDYIESIQSRPK